MFGYWPVEFDPAPRREVVPPVAVDVDPAAAIGHEGMRRANDLPLRVRAGGLDLDRTVPGLLHAWARTSSGAGRLC